MRINEIADERILNLTKALQKIEKSIEDQIANDGMARHDYAMKWKQLNRQLIRLKDDYESEYPRSEKIPKDVANLMQAVKIHCKPYLEAVDGSILKYGLYRGLKFGRHPIIKKQVRLDGRQPKDSNQSMHDIFNDRFVEHFGEPFRNALFVTNDSSDASEYGTVYQIFPIGNFTFLWNTEISDMYTKWDYVANNPDSNNYDDFATNLDYLIAKGTFKTTDLQHATMSNHEIAIRCESYYAIDMNLFDSHAVAIQKIMRDE